MSLEVFWATVRVAADRAESSEKGDLSDGLDLWLSPAVVSDFDVRDFDFLPEEDQTRLAELVKRFSRFAETVDPMRPTTSVERKKGKPLLKEIAEILDLERYQDPDALRLGKLIERELAARGLNEIERWEFKTDYDDHTGDPEIWIWAYLDDAAVETDEKFRDNVRRIRPIIDSAARKIAPSHRPYTAFRSMGELAYLEEVRRAR